METLLPYCDDVTVGVATFTITNLSYDIVNNYLSSTSNLQKLPSARREKIAMAVSQVPVRALLLLFNLPILMQLFAPSSAWTEPHTKIGSASFMAIAATYAWEMSISLRTMGVSNIIHHMIAFWMKFYVIDSRLTSASIEETALLLRIMSLSLSVMVCFGHILTTGFLMLYYIAPAVSVKAFEVDLDLHAIKLSVKAETATLLHIIVWAINVRAIACWSCIIYYMHIYRGSWGSPAWYVMICSLMCILFWMQWGYNFMFHHLEGKKLNTPTRGLKSEFWLRDSFKLRKMVLNITTYSFYCGMTFIWIETGVATFR